MKKIAAIVNPHSGGGKTGKSWQTLEKKLAAALGPVTSYFTEGPAMARCLPGAVAARRALEDGAELVIAVGGDGTINEVVNGFFEDGRLVNPDAAFSFLNAGTGGDFRRTFGYEDEVEAALGRLRQGRVSNIDAGRVTFIADDGEERVRYFANISSFGLSGAVVRRVNRATVSKLFGGKFAFSWGTLVTALGYKGQRVHITTDTGFDAMHDVHVLAAANGRFFGGGMMMAPEAEPDDGMFDIVLMHDMSAMDFLKSSGTLYDGSHVDHEKVITLRARRLDARPVDEKEAVLLDMDGEAPGRLPATFEVLPGILPLYR